LHKEPVAATLELLEYWRDASKEEWRRRTLLGKLLYPIWFAESALKWAIAIQFFGTILLIAWLTNSTAELLDSDPGPSVEGFIYKDGETDDA